MGLRERKQEKQRQLIIENAVALFREAGFEQIRVREIAARCEISEATFFNYFTSKEAVLSEWAHAGIDAAFREAAARPEDASLRRPMRALVGRIAADVEADEALMREAWRRARVVPASAGLRGRPSVEAGGEQLVHRAQARGELRNDLPAEQLAALLRATLVDTLATWLCAPPPTPPEPLQARLGRAIDLVLDGARKRNERVRPGAAQSHAAGSVAQSS